MISKIKRTMALILVMITMVCAIPTTVHAKTDLKTGVAVTTGSSLRLREEASLFSKVIDKADKGEIVVVLDKCDEWYKVIYNLQEGYMHEDYLRFVDKENVELGYGKISGNSVNVRKGPSSSNKSLCKLNNGYEVYIIGINSGWYKVIVNGIIGYVRSDYVELTEIPYENKDSQKEPLFFRNGKKIVSTIDVTLVQKSNATANKSSGSSSNSSNFQSSNTTPVENTSSTNTQQVAQDTVVNNNQTSAENNNKNEVVDNGSNAFGDKIVSIAEQYLGTPYSWGGTSPSGFDCSGFVYYVINKAGFKLSRTMSRQYSAGTPIQKEDLQPGDLVFFQNTYKPGMSHVGIYVGDGQFIHAPSTGKVVSYASMSTDYYISHYYGACRLG